MSGKRKQLSHGDRWTAEEADSGFESAPSPATTASTTTTTTSTKAVVKKKKSCDAADSQEGTPHKQRTRKEPLPMKLRALPLSFWQQPNATNSLFPVYPLLPPLYKDDGVDIGGIRSITPPEERENRQVVSAANTDLLFSLFRGVEQDQTSQPPRIVRRGRPKKAPATLTRVLKDDDPCLTSAVADSILPMIQERNARTGQQSHQVLAMVSFGSGEKTVTLPSLSVEHNYSQILSELVMKL